MLVVIMGVSGVGKTTVGRLLAGQLGWAFYDADNFHSPTNIQKMSQGIPLDDADRAGWLAALADRLRRCLDENQSAVLACSALKERYRNQLQVDASVRFVYLKGSYELVLERMSNRQDHYMKPPMLASQLAALEEPAGVLTIDAALLPEQIVQLIRQSVL